MAITLKEPELPEQNLRQSPEALADIIATAMDAIITVDGAQRIVLFNAAAEKMFHCPADEAMGSSVERFIPQRFRAGHSTRVRQFDQSGVTNRTLGGLGTLWGLRATGEEFPIEASISKIESGGKKFFTVVIRDITERYRAEEGIRESEQRFRLVADSAPVLIWMSGTDKLCTYFNKPWLDFTGRSIEEELGNGWAEGVHPEDLQRCLQTYTRSFDRRESFRMEYRLRRLDGEYRWVLDIGVPRFNQDRSFAGYIGIGVDVTDRRRAEETRIRTAAIVESSDDAIAGLDMNGTITDWNKGAERLFGYSASEAIGENILFLSPADASDDAKRMLKKVREGEVVRHHEAVRQRKDGTSVEISLTVSPIVDSQGRIVGASGIARDITERKRAEKSLKLFRTLVDQSNDAIEVVDPKTLQLLDVNEKACQTLGYTREELLTLTIFDIDPCANESRRAMVQNTLFESGYAVMESLHRRKDGSTFAVEVSMKLVQLDRAYIVTVARDITERKLAEDIITENEKRYRRIVETANEGVWLLDSGLHNSYVNQQVAEMLGYEPGEMVGRSVFDFYFPEDVEQKKQVLTRRQQGRREQIDERLRRKDGSELWVRISGTPVFRDNGEFDGALAMVSDITEQKRAEETLRESEERFRLVANTAPVMIWMSEPDKQPTYFSQLWLDFTGLSETDLQNGLAGIVHPEDYPQCHEVYCRGFDQRQPFRKECRLRRHDGEYRWILDIGVPRFHKDGSFAGYIGSCIDITDQKLAEQAQSSMTMKLVEAQEQERARIARELHDDINQRIAMLAVELEQLKENPSEIERRVQELRNRTSEISNDVQSLSHDLHSSQLEYLGVVAGMKSWCREFGERQKIVIDCRHDVRSTLPREVGLCLFRVLQEALHNAAKHSGVKRIEVQLQEQSGAIYLSVRDLGKGFDVEAARQGRGLGLTSMRERVRLVNGTISVESKLMSGTTIHVRVPLRSEELSERAAG